MTLKDFLNLVLASKEISPRYGSDRRVRQKREDKTEERVVVRQ